MNTESIYGKVYAHRPKVEPDPTSKDFCYVVLEDGRRFGKSSAQGDFALAHAAWHDYRDSADKELMGILRMAQVFLMETRRSQDGNMKDLKQFIDTDSSDLAEECRSKMGTFKYTAEQTWETYLKMNKDIRGGKHVK